MPLHRHHRSVILVLALAMIGGASHAEAPSVTAPQPDAADTHDAAHAAPRARHAAHRSSGAVLDERVASFGKALDLDAGQQAEVRRLLLVERDQLRQLWADPRRPAAERVGATRVVTTQTEDRIRALLTEEQREKYIAPKSAQAAKDRPEHGLDYWMDQLRGPH